MAVSGAFTFSTNRGIIVAAALRKLGVLGEGQTATSASVEIAVEALNFMMKAWQGEGMPVWYLRTAYLYPDDTSGNRVGQVTLGPSSTSGEWSEEQILTKLTVNATSAATTITVATTAAVDVIGTTANSDRIGIEMNDGSIHWTTISAGGGTTSITLGDALSPANQTATSGNRVFAYTTRAQRPTEIEGVWRIEASTGDRVEVSPVGLTEILDETSPTEEGPPIMYNYQATLTDGTFRYWPRFDDGDHYLEILFQNPFDQIDANANELAFPQEWYEAVVYGLAVRLAPEYKLPLQERMLLKQEAQAMKDLAEQSARENASITLQPEEWGNNG